MLSRADIAWFKTSFGGKIARAVEGTPLTVDLVVAIACQETGYIWSSLRRKVETPEEVLALCVGDTLDYSAGRRAFPRTKADLVAAPRGREMFAVARAALEAIARHDTAYAKVARNADKFCHGYGIFQYDIQFFREDPEWFLARRWCDFDGCLEKCVSELRVALAKFGWQGRASLSAAELAHVAIRYNRGGFTPERGLKQGHFDGGKYYGEWIAGFLEAAAAVPMPAAAPVAPAAEAATDALIKSLTAEVNAEPRAVPRLVVPSLPGLPADALLPGHPDYKEPA